MTKEDLFQYLCYYDPLNPITAETYKGVDDIPAPRQRGCACDNCFYGRDKLAMLALSLMNQVGYLEEELRKR